ncbi:hypothetical protein C8F04DRAFT_1186527 [Mycena alexandri]|uniref:Uncharacterized protein n=1 Tax=Mycena alexandri TaxID=1745969 RepID=A0AAD6SMW3_9AGAR|nr:hypothetical protein C8F04DRAFT_1186527 [Mycena alexandri]
MAFRFTSVPTKYTARPLLAPPLPVTLPTLLTSLTPQQFPAPRLLTNIESTRATTPAPPSPPPRAPPTPPPRAPTPRAPSPRAPSRASTPAHQHRSSVSRESSLSSLESEDDSADSPGTASGSTKILRPAGAKIQTVKELFVDRFPELDQEQRNAKYNDFRSRIDHLCGLYLRPTVALAYQAKEDADKVYNKMATTFPWLTSYHNYWPVAVCLQGKLHNSAARAVEKSNKKAVDIIQSVAPARSGSKGARKIESREPEGTLLFTECGHRGSRLRWGNFPDPRTGIKTRKWFNTGLTRLLGRHITLIIAIHPPASLTASTLAPNARWLTLPRVSITRRDFQSTQKLQADFPVLLELSGLPHDPAALFFSQNHDPHLSLPEGVGEISIAKALDGANSPQNSFNDPRAPSRAHKALQAPAPLRPAAQNSRGQCLASLSCFCSIASYPSRPTLTHTMDYISPLLLPKPIFIALKIEYKPTGPCGPGNGRGPAYPFAPHSQTRARALPEMSLTVRHPGPLHPPRAPTPDVLETDGIEVPECEPLVHLDGVSDSLDLSLSTSLSTPHHRPPSRPAPFPLTHPTTFEFAVHARRPSGRRRSESRSPASAPPIKARSRGPLTPTSFDL